MKIWSQCGAVHIAPEDDEERQACEIAVNALHLAYMDQAKTASEVCADCMWRMKFQPVRAISLDMYRLFERWLDEQKETEQ